MSDGGKLAILLATLFGDEPAHLDHNPALRIRIYHPKIKNIAERYSPHAHDPEYLIYRGKHAHHIKTQIKGEHGQFPDRILIKRERRHERKIAGIQRPKARIQGRSSWPQGRKIQSRPFRQ